MRARDHDGRTLSGADGSQRHDVDVLVIGGGPAGTWAAISAAAQGARVLLADKGFCGTSGATAPSGTGLWHVSPDGDARAQAKASRLAMGGHLAEHAWMDRVLAQTWDNVERLKDWGYPFPSDDEGRLRCTSLQGPEYMRLMRKRVKEAGVRILDHSPALELLVDAQGTVAGAAGVHRQTGDTWVARAGAVVIATGGCAFLSKALGCNVLTGDGQLMAAEVGAALSGMEFSNAYGLGPAFSSVTKSLFYNWATFYDRHGQAIEGAGSSRGRSVIAEHLQTQPVFACIDRADAQIRAWMRTAQPNFFVSFDRQGIDPFVQHFPVTLRLEGTVRGTGGLNLVDASCATSVAGLYAAGDAATRELICGGFTGGGSHNAAWALSSGFWAGAGAAAFGKDARARAARPLQRTGGVALIDANAPAFDSQAVITAVQAEVFPYERNWFRQGDALHASLGRLDNLWTRLRRSGPAATATEAVRAREAAAMLATARWMYRSALQRTETRGMHRRREHGNLDPTQRHRLLSGGLDEVWVRAQPLTEALAA
ncbi:FAD-dependent oxidoreductase [Variovorax ginsengisoli]|uniref:Succinate dehydrogenase/fumarate reductase flavoprotein subunit n=1 Tax=Variovorax ginsengisoli TaxID=363844 RepID=A0ABT9S4Q0_9BURK|nr:FAD-binding protein [Variovorax ginsengisoli]MDP9898741.1 succinate dehydrogenase/fumarate reductase flavoprotein subunit [Variovorax ginsengisoli]